MKLFLVFLLLGAFSFTANGAKILGFFYIPSRSHYQIGAQVLLGLAAKGHQVTIASTFPLKEKVPNVRDIYIENLFELQEEHRKQWANMSDANVLTTFFKLSNLTNSATEIALKSKGMQDLMNSGEKFDVVMIEPFGNQACFGLANHFNAHLVLLTTSNSMFVNSFAGNTAPHSYVPNFTLMISDRMTFFQRLMNTISYLMFDVSNEVLTMPFQRELYEKIFKNAPPLDDVIKNASLFLVNSNYIFETPRPYLPNMIHIQEPKKLPKEWQEYLDSATDGAVLFSIGSNIRSEDLPKEKLNIILKTFAKFPKQKFIWKFENDNLKSLPGNVKISKWLPQTDILAHPNLKLFITHGGVSSSTEAVYRGVPILGIPFYGDQFGNIATFVNNGYGQMLAFSDLTEEAFTNALTELLTNKSYEKKIKVHSKILTDQLTSPLDRAIYWIEYVIRHNGARHLRAASLDLNFIQYFLLDVIAFVTFIVGSFIFGIYFVIKKLCCQRKQKTCNIGNKSKKQKTK